MIADDLAGSKYDPIDPLFRRAPAARYVEETYRVPCSPKTSEDRLRELGGPAVRLAGRFPLYPKSGLDAWAQKIGPLVRSTSEVRRVA